LTADPDVLERPCRNFDSRSGHAGTTYSVSFPTRLVVCLTGTRTWHARPRAALLKSFTRGAHEVLDENRAATSPPRRTRWCVSLTGRLPFGAPCGTCTRSRFSCAWRSPGCGRSRRWRRTVWPACPRCLFHFGCRASACRFSCRPATCAWTGTLYPRAVTGVCMFWTPCQSTSGERSCEWTGPHTRSWRCWWLLIYLSRDGRGALYFLLTSCKRLHCSVWGTTGTPQVRYTPPI